MGPLKWMSAKMKHEAEEVLEGMLKSLGLETARKLNAALNGDHDDKGEAEGAVRDDKLAGELDEELKRGPGTLAIGTFGHLRVAQRERERESQRPYSS